MMRKIFWAQNESIDVSNTVINYKGEQFSTDHADIEGYNLFQKLLEIEEDSKPFFKKDNLIIKQHPSGGHFISSNFLETDNSNRRMGFMLFSLELNAQNVIDDLKYYGDILGRTFSIEDLNYLSNNFKIKKNTNLKMILALSTIVLLLLLIFILWKVKN